MEELRIEKAVIYRNGRTHAVFSDRSAGILHPGAQFFTYFSRSGQVLKQVTSCVTCVEDAKEKVLLLLELLNSVALHPVSVLADQVYSHDISHRETHISHISWQIPSLLTILHKETKAEIASVAFDQEHGRAEVVAVFDPSDGSLNLKSVDEFATISLSSDGLLVKVTYPFGLEEKKVVTRSDSRVKGKSGVGIMYQYVELAQIFSTADYPGEWSQPLELLWHAFGVLGNKELRPPTFYSSADPQEPTSGEFRTTLQSPIPGEIWKSDSLSPAVTLFSYFESAVFVVWTPEATLRNVPGLGIEGVIHVDQAKLICTEGSFFHYIAKGGESRSFSRDTVPVTIRRAGGSYSIQRVVEDCVAISSQPSVYPKAEQVIEEEGEDPEGIKCENVVEGVATFTAYNDKSMRALFDDRTVLRVFSDMTASVISRKGEMLKLTMDKPYGYEAYIPICLEFYEWAFTSPEEKARKQLKEAEIRLTSQLEIEKIDRILHPETAQDQNSFSSLEIYDRRSDLT